jgi:hypothetical protein
MRMEKDLESNTYEKPSHINDERCQNTRIVLRYDLYDDQSQTEDENCKSAWSRTFQGI